MDTCNDAVHPQFLEDIEDVLANGDILSCDFIHVAEPNSPAANDGKAWTASYADWINSIARARLAEIEDNWSNMATYERESLFVSTYHCLAPSNQIRKRAARLLKRFDSRRVHIHDQSLVSEFKQLPDIVTLYRGAKNGSRIGISWTTNLEVARWFACESINQDDGHVLKLVIPKQKISAYVGGKEAECLVKVKHGKKARFLESTDQIRRIRQSHWTRDDWLNAYGEQA